MEATIRRSGNLIQILPPTVEQYLAPLLCYTKRVQDGKDSKQVKYENVSLYKVDGDGLITFAGLTSKVVTALNSFGVTLKFEDYRKVKLPEPEYGSIDPVRSTKQIDILSLLVSNDCGVFKAPTGFGKSWLIRQIPKLWPHAKIIICSPFTGVVEEFYDELVQILPPEQVGIAGGGNNTLNKRVMCCVSNSLRKCDLENCEIFVFDEVHKAAASHTKATIAKIRNARMYGFSASPYGRSDNADLETEAMFGPMLCEISYQEVEEEGNSLVPIEIYTFDCSHLPPAADGMAGVPLERWGLWRNAYRNEVIQRSIEWAKNKFGVDAQTLITVGVVEHAVHLAPYFPGYELIYGTMGAEKRKAWEKQKLIPEGVHPMTATHKREIKERFSAGTSRNVIATATSGGLWSTGVNFPYLNILSRADGQSGSILNTQIPGRVTRKVDGKEVGIIVEYNDAFNHTLHGRYNRRAAEYKKKGWTIVDVESSEYMYR